MKFEELYNLISEGKHYETVERGVDPTPEGAKTYTNNDLKGNRYVRFDLGYANDISNDIAKIVYDFIIKTNDDNGYYTEGIKIISYFYDHPLLPAQISYCIIAPIESKELGVLDSFMQDLWEYGLKVNKDKWKSHFSGTLDMYTDRWGQGHFKVSAEDKIYIWEYDPMDEYSTDKETKEVWRDVVGGL